MVARVAMQAGLEEDIFDDPSMAYILEEVEKDGDYLELKLAGEGVSRKELRRTKRDSKVQKWLYIWDHLGMMEKGSKRVLVVNSSLIVVPEGLEKRFLGWCIRHTWAKRGPFIAHGRDTTGPP